MGNAVEGHMTGGSRVAVVDDTCTTGGSLFQAIEAAEAEGCTVVKVLAILDRREGGSEELSNGGGTTLRPCWWRMTRGRLRWRGSSHVTGVMTATALG